MPTETAATKSLIGDRRDASAVAQQLANASCSGDKGAGDRGGARAAVGLDHVAVEVQGALAQRVEIDDGAQRAADQALDFLRAAGLLAARGFAVACACWSSAAACRIRR